MGKDFYGVLGVSKDADDAAIKKAYRRVARRGTRRATHVSVSM